MKHLILLSFLFFSPFVLAAKGKKAKCEQTLEVPSISLQRSAEPIEIEVQSIVARALEDLSVAPELQPKLKSLELSRLFKVPPTPEIHFAFASFQLAGILKQPPAKIAENLSEKIKAMNLPLVERVQAVDGYVNFYLRFSEIANQLKASIEHGRFFQNPQSQVEKISLEYSQPNTHKALHVGHMRNMFLGDSVARLLEYFGHRVVRSTYPGDLGTHIAEALWYIKTFKAAEIPSQPSAEWLGRMYAEAKLYLKSHEDEVKPQITQVLHNIENGTGPDYELYIKTREWSLNDMKQVYAWLGIRFDCWYFESQCDRPSRELVEQKFKEGLLIKDEGAIGLDLKKEGLGFAMLLTRNGTGLYLTKDLELLRQKFSDPEVTRSIVVVDERQRLHFQQAFRTAEVLGFPQARQSIHLAYETVNNEKDEPFSSRTLNGITLKDLKASMIIHLGQHVLRPYPLGKSIEAIAADSLRYEFLKTAPNNKIIFDVGRFMEDDYKRVLRKFWLMEDLIEWKRSSLVASEFTPREKEIVMHLRNFNKMAERAARNFDPSEVVRYLETLTAMFPNSEQEPLVHRREIAELALPVMGQALKLLGIETN